MIVRCNWCMEVMDEDVLIWNEEIQLEECPYCKNTEYLMDLDDMEDLDNLEV